MSSYMVDVEHVYKTYNIGSMEVNALDDISFTVNEGEFSIVLGPSGAGKTTVLNIIGGMDHSTNGKLVVGGKDLSTMKSKDLTLYRRNTVGFVFQLYNLMPNLTALENVELSTELCKDALDPMEVLTKVGLKDRANNFPGQLSGGEQQRVSIARALAKNPKLILCDEPTGALDYKTGKSILSLLHEMSRNEKKTVLIVTHNSALKDMADKVIHIKNGRAEKEEINLHPKDISEIEW